MSGDTAVPAGMTPLRYPAWATTTDPDIPHQLTSVAVRLYELFGSGTPATSALPEFPFSTATGAGSGIDAYDKLKAKFQRIESECNSAAKAFKSAVQESAYRTQAGRDAINDAIATFNTTAATLDEGDWDGLLQAESTMLAAVKTHVSSAAQAGPGGAPDIDYSQGVPLVGYDYSQGTPLPGVDTPPTGTPPAATTDRGVGTGGLEGLLSKIGSGGGLPMGGNPLGAGLGGLNPMSGQGNPSGGGGSPLAPQSNALKPLSTRTDTDSGDSDEKSPIAPLNLGPQNPPPTSAPAAAETAGHTEQGQTAHSTDTRATVTLPDGTVVEAPNTQAADAAQNALDNASPGGDSAQKAYSPTGLDLSGNDGKNLGTKVDPSAVQPGDVLKWQDKTMVAVGPNLVADPSEPGVTHTLDAVFKDQKGFEGVFRPTETNPTLSTHTSTQPLPDLGPARPPAASSGSSAAAPQFAPPSPFEAPTPPPRAP